MSDEKTTAGGTHDEGMASTAQDADETVTETITNDGSDAVTETITNDESDTVTETIENDRLDAAPDAPTRSFPTQPFPTLPEDLTPYSSASAYSAGSAYSASAYSAAPAGPRVRVGAIVWGVLVTFLAAMTLVVASSSEGRSGFRTWVAALNPASITLLGILGLGIIILLITLASALRRMQRSR